MHLEKTFTQSDLQSTQGNPFFCTLHNVLHEISLMSLKHSISSVIILFYLVTIMVSVDR